jgi:hypothetical protein
MNRILCPQRELKLDSGKVTKVIVSGKRTPRFPIDTDKVISITKNLRGIELTVEFERK